MKESENAASVECYIRRDLAAGHLYRLLKDKFSDERQWLCAGEVSDCTGGGNRRLDFVAVNCYASQGYGIHAFEIKVSKSDLRRELEDPSKHNVFFDWVDTYSIVAPDYVLDAEYKSIIPPNWGIYTVCERGVWDEEAKSEKSELYLKTVRKPLSLHDEKDLSIKRSFAMSLLRSIRNQNAERFYLDELMKKEYLRGREDGLANASYELDRYKKMFTEEGWKLQYFEMLGIFSKERAEKSIPKIKAAIRMYDEIEWLKNRIDDLATATATIRTVSEELRGRLDENVNGNVK